MIRRLVPFIVLGLTGCGAIPVPLGNDPFGLSGQQLTVMVQPDGVLSAAATATTPTPITVTFNNIDIGRAPRPARILADVSLETELTLEGVLQPAELTLRALRFDAELSEPGRAPVAFDAALQGAIVFAQEQCDGSSCTYRAAAARLDAATLELDGEALAIVFGGSEPNRLTLAVTLELESSPELAAGTTITLTLRGGRAVARV